MKILLHKSSIETHVVVCIGSMVLVFENQSIKVISLRNYIEFIIFYKRLLI